MIETKVVCPLGNTCEEVVSGVIQRCAWYVALEGIDPQSGDVIKESKCAMAWQPILMIEGNRESNHLNHSIQSMRNETTKRQDIALGVINNAKVITST